MKITTVFAATLATAGAVAVAPIAAAETGPQIHDIGQQAELVNGNVVQGWTITNLMPSTDVIPYQPRGTLWEATATDQAVQGSVTPIVSNLNARASDGQTYRALFQVATPQGVNPSTIPQGQQTSGKVYFDVTGAQPDSVVYNDGARDLLVWVKPANPPATSSGSGSSSSSSGSSSSGSGTTGYSSSAPQAAEAAPAPAAAPGTPAPAGAQMVPAPAGSTGTPLPAGSAGTPLPASVGTPAPAGSAGTPIPAGAPGAAMAPAQGTPLPPAQGTPVPPAQGTPLPPVQPAAATPVPASNGTPHAGGPVAPATTPVPVP